MSTRTPGHLRTQYGIGDEGDKCRAFPRAWLSYCGPKKPAFLATVYSMVSAGALPESGQKRWRRPVTQRDLGASCGLRSRSTFTRRVSDVADAPAQVASAEVPPRYRRPSLLRRRRSFGAPNQYEFGAIAGAWQDQRDPERYHAPAAAELAAHRETGHLFDARCGRTGGFKDVPAWVWSEKLPLSDTARLVLTYYVMCGLLESGEVHPRQATVARMVGITPRSVYSANKELTALALIRVAHPKLRKAADGALVRGPARIVYLPMRTLTSEEAATEAKRLLDARKRYGHQTYWNAVYKAHDALLGAWMGHDHTLDQFRRQIRRMLLLQGIPLQVINDLIPAPPD